MRCHIGALRRLQSPAAIVGRLYILMRKTEKVLIHLRPMPLCHVQISLALSHHNYVYIGVDFTRSMLEQWGDSSAHVVAREIIVSLHLIVLAEIWTAGRSRQPMCWPFNIQLPLFLHQLHSSPSLSKNPRQYISACDDDTFFTQHILCSIQLTVSPRSYRSNSTYCLLLWLSRTY